MNDFTKMITTIIGIVLVSIIFENIIPSGTYKKYIKFTLGLVILITVITSIFNLLSISYEFDINDYIVNENLEGAEITDYKSTIKSEFLIKLNDEIENSIKNDMGIICDVTCEVNNELDEISVAVRCNKGKGIYIKDYIIKKYELTDVSVTEEVNFVG